MIICWINKGSCYLVWSEPPAFLCQSVSLPKLKFDNFEVELKHDLNHWIVRVRRAFDPAGSWALQVLWSNPSPQRMPSSSLDWLAQGHTPVSFEHIQGANSLASQCRITVMVKIVFWYCSVSAAVTLSWCSAPLEPVPVCSTPCVRGEGPKKLLHHVLQPQGMLECPSHTALSWMLVTVRMHWHKLQPGWLQAPPACALGGLSAPSPQPLDILLLGLPDWSLFRYVNSPCGHISRAWCSHGLCASVGDALPAMQITDIFI